MPVWPWASSSPTPTPPIPPPCRRRPACLLQRRHLAQHACLPRCWCNTRYLLRPPHCRRSFRSPPQRLHTPARAQSPSCVYPPTRAWLVRPPWPPYAQLPTASMPYVQAPGSHMADLVSSLLQSAQHTPHSDVWAFMADAPTSSSVPTPALGTPVPVLPVAASSGFAPPPINVIVAHSLVVTTKCCGPHLGAQAHHGGSLASQLVEAEHHLHSSSVDGPPSSMLLPSPSSTLRRPVSKTVVRLSLLSLTRRPPTTPASAIRCSSRSSAKPSTTTSSSMYLPVAPILALDGQHGPFMDPRHARRRASRHRLRAGGTARQA